MRLLAFGAALAASSLACDVYPGPEAPNQGAFVGDVDTPNAYDNCYLEQLDVSTFGYVNDLELDEFSNQGGNSFACQNYPNLVVPEVIKVDVPSFGVLTGIDCCDPNGDTFLVPGSLEPDALSESTLAANFWTSISPSELELSTTSSPNPALLDSQIRATQGVSSTDPTALAITSTYFWPQGAPNGGNIVTVVQVYSGGGTGSFSNRFYNWGGILPSGDPNSEANEADQILKHELGHAVGIRGHHQNLSNALMDATISIGETLVTSTATQEAMLYLYKPIVSQRPIPIP